MIFVNRTRHARVVAALLILALAVSCFTKTVSAGSSSATISVSSVTVTKGDTFTLKVTASASFNLGYIGFILTFDDTKMKYNGAGDTVTSSVTTVRSTKQIQVSDDTFFDAGSALVKKRTYSFQFTALDVAEAGTTVTISSKYVSSQDEENLKPANSTGTVTIKPIPEASSDANLASLAIGEAKISPEFNKDTTKYTASVGSGVSKVTVTAKASHAKAKVAVSGTTNLKEGDNTVTVKVTAEDGKTVKTYTIIVTKAKAPTKKPVTPKPATATPTLTPPVKATVNGQDVVVKGKPNAKYLQETTVWESTTVEYKKQKIEALKNIATGETVVELSDGNLYILDTEKGTAIRYTAVDNPSLNLVLQEVTDEVTIPLGYQKTTKSLNGTDVTAFVSFAESEYAIVYAKSNTGFTGWFQWDLKDNTFQRFNTEDVVLNPTPIPTPTPVPTATPTPSPTPVPTEPEQPTVPETKMETQKAKSILPVPEEILLGASGVVFVFMLLFLILYLVQKRRYNKRFAPDENYSDDDDYL